jgi:RTX calcium-binding nonapeptide repeat (4 copies)
MDLLTSVTGLFSRRAGRRAPAARHRKPVFETLEHRILLSVDLLGAPVWVPEGPAPITDGGTFPGGGNVVGPTAAESLKDGAVNQTAVDPNDPKHLFVATVNGGVWETSDFTVANPLWTTTTDRLPSLAIDSIAVSPVDSNVVYAGTGSYSSIYTRPFGGDTHIDGAGGRAVGVYKSTDGGDTWQIQNPGGMFTGLRIVRIIPTTLNGGETVFLATTDGGPAGGVFRSDDGGDHWTRLSGANGLPNSGVTDLVANPNDPNQFYAATSNTIAAAGAGIYLLDAGGGNTSWVNVTNDMVAADVSASERIELSISAAGVNPIWASITNASQRDASDNVTTQGEFYQRIYRGVAGGGTVNWTAVGPSGGQAPDILAGNQGAVHGAMVADPTADNLVYVAGDRINSGFGGTSGYVVRGDSTANTWTGITPVGSASGDAGTAVPTANAAVHTSPHADSRDLVFAAGGVLLYGSDGGLYQATSPGSGTQTWTYVGGNIQDTEVYNVAYDSQFDIIFGGAQDNGTPSQNAPGSTSSYHDESGGDGGATAVDNYTLAGSGESVRYFFGKVRKVYDGANSRVSGDADSNILPAGGLAGLTSSTANDLFAGSVVNAIAPTAAQITAGQSTRVLAFGGTNATVTVGALYESSDAGSASASGGFVNDSWTQITTGAGFVKAGAIAYGGRSGGVDNPDVLYVASGSRIYLRTISGGTLDATAAQPLGAGAIVSIALDPNDWNRAFVTDGSRIYMTENHGGSWTNITGNVNTSGQAGSTLSAIGGSGDTALLLAHANGVQRMLVSDPGVWSRYGAGLPNAVNGGLVYNAADDVLVNATYGRGFWEVANASDTVFSTAVLQITGDTDFANENDLIKLIRDDNNPLLLDVYLNGVLSQWEYPVIQRIDVSGLGGQDELTIDFGFGDVIPVDGINYDGGAGTDSLQFDHGTFNTVTYNATGPGAGNVDFGGGDVVTFDNLAPVTDNSSATHRVFNDATGLGQTIEVVDGGGGLTTIDDGGTNGFESVSFAPPSSDLAVNAGDGNDSIVVDFGSGTDRINVNGGAGDDTLQVNGTASSDSIVVSSTQVTRGGERVAYQQIEDLAVAAGAGDDDLTVLSTSAAGVRLDGEDGSDAYTVDFGSLAGPVEVNDSGPGGDTDTLLVNGTPGDDALVLAASSITRGAETVNYFGIEQLTLDAGAGNDAITVNGTGATTTVLGGDGDDTFVVNANGNFTLTLDGEEGSDTYEIGIGALIGPVVIDDTGTAGTDTLLVNGTPFDDVITLTDTAITGLGGGMPFNLSFSGIEVLAVDAKAGDDLVDGSALTISVTIYGGDGDDTLIGGSNDDHIYGQDGNDDLIGNLGADYLDGGAGSDGLLGDMGTIERELVSGGGLATLLTTQNGKLEAYIDRPGTIRRKVTLTNADQGGDDTLIGGTGDDYLHGGAGDDSLDGGDGLDALFGDDGNDSLSGGVGDDHLYGGAGDDVLDGGAGADIAYGGAGEDTLIADSSGDRLIDWFGNFNRFVVPGPGFGAPVIVRAPAPWARDFLSALAADDGATDLDAELGIVIPGSSAQRANSGKGG